MVAMETLSHVDSDMSDNFKKKSPSLVAFAVILKKLLVNVRSRRGQKPPPPTPDLNRVSIRHFCLPLNSPERVNDVLQ